MRLLSIPCITVCLIAGLNAHPLPTTAERPRALHALSAAPIRFEPNVGQMDARARFAARGLNYGFAFLGDETILSLAADNGSAQTIAMRFAGSNPEAAFEGCDPLSVTTNYFRGDRSRWRFGVPNFRRLLRKNVYPGIDVVFYGNGSQLEYDFVVHPGADPVQIRLQFAGADRIRTDARGDLILTLGSNDLVQRKPLVYQTTRNGKTRLVAGGYEIRDGEVRFALADYDRSRLLTVDPALVYSQYLGGSLDDIPVGVGVDRNGLIYIAGSTVSTDFVLGGSPYDTTNSGDFDAFVVVVDPSQGGLITYASYVGGSGVDHATAMEVDANGLVCVTGTTLSSDFPTPNGFQPNYVAENDGFFFALDTTQAGTDGLIYSTYFGGSNLDIPFGLTLDTQGKIYITGRTTSTDFPVTANAFQPALEASDDAFLIVFDLSQAGGASLSYSTFFGGDRSDVGRSVAVDSKGVIYLAGSTFSDDLPAGSESYDGVYQEGGDAFVAVIDLTKAAPIQYFSYFGGSDLDEFLRVRVDAKGRIVLAGYTLSTDMPVTPNAAQPHFGGETDAILAILDIAQPAVNQLVYSSYLGGSNPEVAMDVQVDASGGVYLTGYTQSTDFPVVASPLQQYYGGGGADGFLARIDPSKTSNTLTYGTYIGGIGYNIVYGIALDRGGNLYLTGSTTSTILPDLNQAARISAVGNADVFLLEISPK
ncbi:MAG TPA: SBBP repeat-containing protein [Bryobacteraceae bacterium]|nr:SBBP repeat-containing protein [Bryobacteraceae bacterium]